MWGMSVQRQKRNRIWGCWKHGSKWTNEKRWRRRNAALWRQSFMRWWGENGHGGCGMKKKIKRMGKERGMEWWRLISLRAATPSLPCSPVLSHSILSLLLFSRNIRVGGRDRECEKVTVSDDRVRGRVTEEGADLKTFHVIADFYVVNWSSWNPTNIPAGLVPRLGGNREHLLEDQSTFKSGC